MTDPLNSWQWTSAWDTFYEKRIDGYPSEQSFEKSLRTSQLETFTIISSNWTEMVTFLHEIFFILLNNVIDHNQINFSQCFLWFNGVAHGKCVWQQKYKLVLMSQELNLTNLTYFYCYVLIAAEYFDHDGL